jgi:ComF family protein
MFILKLSGLNRIAHTIQEIVYPRYCLLCRRRIAGYSAKDLICVLCIDTIKPNAPPFCPKCGRNMPGIGYTEDICPDCRSNRYHFDRAWAGYIYEGTVREIIHNFKYKNKIKLGKYLSQLVIGFAQEYRLPINGCDYVIPVPLSPAKLREREFNQAQILASAIADYFDVELLSDGLRRIRNCASQTELDRRRRWKNVKGTFALKNAQAVRGKTILLIDDVLTTGATASEAAKTLKCAGASSVFVLTVAN